MDDVISRQAAKLKVAKVIWEDGDSCYDFHDKCVDCLDDVPSAQPERKRGKWVFYEDRAPVWDIAGEKTWARAYKCSECGFVHSVIEDFGQYTFCPNCGADMREVTE